MCIMYGDIDFPVSYFFNQFLKYFSSKSLANGYPTPVNKIDKNAPKSAP